MLESYIRKKLSRFFTGEKEIALQADVPSPDVLRQKFRTIKELGIYLHIPFCEQICPYCPYNKEIFQPTVAKSYALAVKKEIDFYSGIVGDRPVTSFYIGGGTPTTMLHCGLEDILSHIFSTFNMHCEIHIESHPNHLNSNNLQTLKSLGVTNLSVGIEALQDRHLSFLKRPYTTNEVKSAINQSVKMGFKCVNADLIFALPNQTYDEVAQAGKTLVEMGVNQVAAYPLFRFPYTKMGSAVNENGYKKSTLLKRKKMLSILEDIFYSAGFERTSVWAFTQRGIPKYCSVTVPLYIGLGVSGGSYLEDIFYLNTFNVAEYINALECGKMATALSLNLPEEMQMAGWLYWRIYETRFTKHDFYKRFGKDFDNVYGKYLKPFALLGFLEDDGDQIVLSDKGNYWLHAFEDFFSIDYISNLWGTSKQKPWPEKIVL
ncbi:MAG: coproporphyrinogen-III oxidase family protein [Candidatus Zhuqueibacterota bacterium]